jgi:hypothetical protein
MFFTYDANLNYHNVTKKAPLHFKMYSDPSHSWLAVKKTILEKYGILNEVSIYSYVKGGTYYLEEDRDASLLIKTLVDANVSFTIEDKMTNNESIIRRYPSVS